MQRGFVIAFSRDTDIEKGRVAGRVEHVATGRATQFASVEELLSFVQHVLASGVANAASADEDEIN